MASKTSTNTEFRLKGLRVGDLLVVSIDMANSTSDEPEDVYQVVKRGDQPTVTLVMLNSKSVWVNSGGCSGRLLGSQDPKSYHQGRPMKAGEYYAVRSNELVIIKPAIKPVTDARNTHLGSGLVKHVRIETRKTYNIPRLAKK